MTAEAFVDVIRQMVGLPPSMIQHLEGLAKSMTEEERQDTVKKLEPVHAEIQKQQQELIAEADAGQKVVSQMSRDVLPKLHADAERKEHDAADALFPEDAQ